MVRWSLGVGVSLLLGASAACSSKSDDDSGGSSGSSAAGTTASGDSGHSGAGGSAGHATGGSAGATGGSGGSLSGGAAGKAGSGGAAGTDMALVTDPSGARATQLALDSGYLYWLSGTHQIARSKIDGSGAEVIFTRPGDQVNTIAIGAFAVAEGYLYFTDTGERDDVTVGVYKIPVAGGTAVQVAPAKSPYAMSLGGNDICFVDGSDIKHVTLDGGAVTTVATSAASNFNTEVLASGGYCYFPSNFGDTSAPEDLYRVPVPADDGAGGMGGAGDAGGASGGATPPPEKISVQPGRLQILLSPRTDQGFIYWSCFDQVFRWMPGQSGDPTQVLVTTDPLQPDTTAPPTNVLMPSDGTLYWVGGTGTIFKATIPDGDRTTVAHAGPNSIALDATYVYAAIFANIFRYPR